MEEDIALTQSGGSYLSRLERLDSRESKIDSEDYITLKYFQLGGHLEDLLGSNDRLDFRKSVIRRLFEAGYLETTSENRYRPLIR